MAELPSLEIIELGQASGLPGFVQNAAMKLREQQRAPAVQPSRLIQQPIFWNSRKATRYTSATRSYTMRDNGVEVTYVAETTNAIPLPPTGRSGTARESRGTEMRHSPHGLMRFSDLDVLMALSYHFTRYGRSLIEVDTRTVLTWMGYGQFDEAPYRELRASLQRMASTTISVSMKGAKIADYCPSRLVALHGTQGIGGALPRGMIRASLSEDWRQSLGKGFTLVDMHAYAHLCRVDRECGLARVLFLFLASLKDYERGTFNIPLTWIAERWRDTTGENAQPVYADPLDRRGHLYEACRLLHSSGVMSIAETDEDERGRRTRERRLCGVFAPAANIPRIPDEGPRQVALFVGHRLTGELAEAPAETGASPPALPASVASPPDDEPAAPSTMPPADVLRSEVALFTDESIAALIHDLGLSPRAMRKAMRGEAWSDHKALARMLLVTSWRHHVKGEVEKPAQYVAKVMSASASDDPAWQTAEVEAQHWAMSDAGPLRHLRVMADRIAELRRSVVQLPKENQNPRVSRFDGQDADASETVGPEDLARQVLQELGVQVREERVRMLCVLPDRVRMERTARRLSDDWSEEDSSPPVEEAAVGEDEEAVERVARELAEHREAAAKLGHAVSPIAKRYAAAAAIVADPVVWAAWRRACGSRA
jgi:hypothetical protein